MKNQSQENTTSLIIKTAKSSIEVKILGSGEPIVMIPALGRSTNDFKGLSQRLVNAGFRVILPEPKGIGQSAGLTDDLTLHDLAIDIATIIQKVGASPANVLGHAFGNRVARTVASDYPERVKSVILLAAGGKIPPEKEIRQAANKCHDLELPREERTKYIKYLFANGNDPSAWENGWYAEVRDYQSKANVQTKVEDWWVGGSAPILVLQGLEDRMAVPENAIQIQKDIGKRMTLVEIPKSGHAMLPEQPELIAKAIIDYLKK